MGVRIPDGILLLYCPTLVNFVVSPARMLCLMDPLLPFSFMMGCLRAYTCPDEEVEKKQRRVAQLLNTPTIKSKTHQPFTSTTASRAIDPRGRRSTLGGMSVVDVEVGQECVETPKGATNSASDYSNSIDLSACDTIPEDDGVNGKSELSDTMASASAGSVNSHSNITEAPTPDESNGISFEEDSQPIRTKPFPDLMMNGKDTAFYGELDDDDMNLDDELRDDPTAQYVSEFLDR